MKINLRESLNKIDLATDNKYDLLNTFNSKKLSDDSKKKLAEAIENNSMASINKILNEEIDTEYYSEEELAEPNFKVILRYGPSEILFEDGLTYEEAENLCDEYGYRWLDEKGFLWEMDIEDNSYELEECMNTSNKLNESSDFAIDTFSSFSPEYAKLSAICILLNSMSPNKINYRVEDTYFDYGQDWRWTTIIAHRNNGDSWQAIYPAMQERILLAGDFDATDTAEFVNDPEFEEIAKDILRESRLDKGFDESLKEANYGGAYDIEDDMFFTKEDIVEFAEEICEYLGDIFGYQYDINNVYMVGPRKLYINIYDNNYIEVESTFDIDMRKIRKPSDLSKVYGLTIENWFQKAFAREYRDAGLDESLTEAKKVGSNELTNKRGLPRDSWELVKITDGVVSYKGTNECDIYSRELDNNYSLYDYYQGEVIFDDYGINNPQLIQDVFPDVGTKVKLAIYKVPEDDPDHHWTGDYFVDYIDEINESLKEDTTKQDESIDISDYEELHYPLRDGDKYYQLYRKIEDGKGVWAAAELDKYGSDVIGEPFKITYEQARGFEPIEDSSIRKLSRDLGKKLLPKIESLKEAYRPLAIGYMILKKEIPNHVNYAEFANYDEVVTAIPSEADVVVYPRGGKISGTDIAYWQFDAIDSEGKKTKANFSTYVYSLKDFLNNDEMELKLIPDFKLINEYPYLIEVDDDMNESLTEDTVKTKSGKWVNKGDTGKTHGEFKTKKAADEQRKAMFAQGWKKESLEEKLWFGKYVTPDHTLKKVYFYNNYDNFDDADADFDMLIPEPYIKKTLQGKADYEILLKNDGYTLLEKLEDKDEEKVAVFTRSNVDGKTYYHGFMKKEDADKHYPDRLKEAIDDEIDLDYETDFNDGEVEEGNTFIEDGREWSWIERIAGPIHLDFDNWAVWSARDWDYIQEKVKPLLINKEEFNVEVLTKIYDEAEVAYFVVDEDTGFIDWGPVETSTEAQDFLNGKVEDYENDEEYEEVEIEEESLKESINQNDVFKFLNEIKDTVSSFKNRVQEVSEYFNISEDEAEDFVYDWEQENSLTESKAIKNDDDFEVTLHYDDIGDGKEYDYTLGYDEVVSYLKELAWANGDGPEDLNEDEYLEWAIDNFDELADKYELNVLNYFESEASQYEYDHRYDEP